MVEFAKESLEGYVTDADAEINGIWVEVNEHVRFCIRRTGGRNAKYSRRIQEIYRKHRRQLERGTMSEDKEQRMMREVYVETCVVDWNGVRDAAGKEVPFTVPNCLAYFEAVPDVYATLRELSSDIDLFKAQEAEEAAEDLGES